MRILLCNKPLLMAHGRSHGRRLWRPVTGSKPASRTPLRQSRFGAQRATARRGRGGGSFSLMQQVPPRSSGHDRGVEPAGEIGGGRRASSPASPARRSTASRRMPGDVPRPSMCPAAAQGCRWCNRPARWRSGASITAGERSTKLARPAYGGGPTCEGCKSIDVRRWHREGRPNAGQQFSWCWTCGGEPSGNISVRSEPDAMVLMYRSRRWVATRCRGRSLAQDRENPTAAHR
jgi:hypothetical protein